MSGNSKKARFLASIPLASLDAPDDTLAGRCKFNFSYFTRQAAGQDFADCDAQQLVKLLDKLKDYSKEPLAYWKNLAVGKSGSVLAIYGAFPQKSSFTHPKHVPHQAQWGRFRLDHTARLIGFVLPQAYHEQMHPCNNRFDCNTFYVVFLDQEHSFYQNPNEAK
ncbi:MAG: hypothetical protein RL748_4244 [Pseudomonadota bacterium]|jgi:hypothetical protein